MKKSIIAAPDSFKGSLSAGEAANAICRGVESALKNAGLLYGYDILSVPVADGGEGMAETIGNALNAEKIKCSTFDSVLRPITAEYRMHDSTAYIDLAAASGLALIENTLRNPMNTTTYGTGVMIRDALEKGATEIVVGLGGSATNEAGLGALQALGLKIYDRNNRLIGSPVTGKDLNRIGSIDNSGLVLQRKAGIRLACDVKTPFSGLNGASRIFAPQKGASPGEAVALDNAMKRLERIFAGSGYKDISNMKGAGAAGGSGGGFAALAGGMIENGIELVIGSVGFDKMTENAALIFTGEGSADRQTLLGKAPLGVLRHSEGIPVALLAGRVSDREQLIAGGFRYVECINPPGMNSETAMKFRTASSNLAETSEKIMKAYIDSYLGIYY